MCGLVGLYTRHGTADRRVVEELAKTLRHRGPDETTSWASGSIAFAHTRLKILDPTEAARQPMSSEDGGVRLVYNGEVYNFVQLRRELETRGHRFASTGDTEVVLRSYLEWGEQCFERFNGMFALAIWDSWRNSLLLARDAFGIKPLYVRRMDGSLAFASEPQTLLRLGPNRANEGVLADFLTRGRVDHRPRETFFSEIERVPPGALLVFQQDGERTSHWWQLEVDPSVEALSEQEKIESIREIFVDSVRLRLRSDVPVGACLSGGIDSSAIVGAVGAEGMHIRTFTAWANADGRDERSYARAAAAGAHAEAHFVEVSDRTLGVGLDDAIRSQAEPVSSASILMQRAVMQLAHAQGVTVVLDGQGGDELFGGYQGSFGPAILDRALEEGPAAAVREALAVRRRDGLGACSLVREVVRPLVPNALLDVARRRSRGAPTRLPIPPLHDRWPRRHPFLRHQLQHILERQGLPALLRYEDRNSMAFSIEARLPFLDSRLVRFAHSLRSSDLVRGGSTKWIFRQAACPLIPDLVRKRSDKVGFGAPDKQWFVGAGYAFAREVLLDGATARSGYVNMAATARLLEKHRSGTIDASGPLWRLLNVALWHRELVTRFGYPAIG